MDLTETMKNVLAKSLQQQNAVNDLATMNMNLPFPLPAGNYITEKVYTLLQLYLQNKGWNPSMELLQCITELKEASMLPSAAYLQLMATRVSLDSQGRLILRENGKVILPVEQFSNAIMLKHVSGPHGLHLGVEATIRAVMEAYSFGRENFGMEKEYIIDVIQECPNNACRYYKSQMEFTQKQLQHAAAAAAAAGFMTDQHQKALQPPLPPPPPFSQHSRMNSLDLASAANTLIEKSSLDLPPKPPTQQQIAALIQQQQHHNQQQQNRSTLSHQNLEKINQNFEKHRHHNSQQQQHQQQQIHPQTIDLMVKPSSSSSSSASSSAMNNISTSVNSKATTSSNSIAGGGGGGHFNLPAVDYKLSDFIRANLDSLQTSSLPVNNKDLLALHNGAWANQTDIIHNMVPPVTTSVGSSICANSAANSIANITNTGHGSDNKVVSNEVSQEKIIRTFGEIMKNMQRMKSYVRPSMCKPYGKQSESLQKTLMDTIQVIQTLRSYLPPPHIQVNSWKNDDKHRYDDV